MAAQTNEVTNLALHRQAWASSAIDYNMTAHLVTDGINDSTKPMPLTVRTPGGRLPRREAEWTLDGNEWSSNVVMGDTTWIEYSYGTTEVLWFAGARKVKIDGRVAYDDTKATKGYRLAWQVSDDGQTWITVGEVHGDGLPGKAYTLLAYSKALKCMVRLVIWIMRICHAPGMITKSIAVRELLTTASRCLEFGSISTILKYILMILAAPQPLKTSFHGTRLAQNLALCSICTNFCCKFAQCSDH